MRVKKDVRCATCGKEMKNRGSVNSVRCRACHIALVRAGEIPANRPTVSCTCTICGTSLQAKGKQTATRCISCYMERGSMPEEERLSRERQRAAAWRAAHAKQCIDCGAVISPRASRCKACQNARRDLMPGRMQKSNATKMARADESKMLPNAGRRRAQKLFPLGPCAMCGKPGSLRHHIDENTFNNTPENIMILCAGCHMDTHQIGGRRGQYATS